MLKAFVMALVFLCVSAVSFAVEPTSGLSIVSQGDLSIGIREQSTLSFLITAENSSFVSPSSLDFCDFALYNSSNNKLVSFYNLTKGINFVSTQPLNSSNFFRVGTYPYLVRCQTNSSLTTPASGFLTGSIEVNNDGEPHEKNPFIAGILIILPVLIGFLLVFAAGTLGDDHSAFRIFLFLLGALTFEISLWFGSLSALTFYNFPELGNALSSVATWYGRLLFVMVVYFLIYAFYKITKRTSQEQEERMNY